MMTSKYTIIKMAALASAMVMLADCGSIYESKYRDAIQENQQGLTKLKIGMSRDQVIGVLGQGEIVRYRKILLVDPWKTEEFQRSDGEHVVVMYYLIQHPRSWKNIQDSDLIPLVVENDRLTGWGWAYLRSQTDRADNSTALRN